MVWFHLPAQFSQYHPLDATEQSSGITVKSSKLVLQQNFRARRFLPRRKSRCYRQKSGKESRFSTTILFVNSTPTLPSPVLPPPRAPGPMLRSTNAYSYLQTPTKNETKNNFVSGINHSRPWPPLFPLMPPAPHPIPGSV